MTKKQKNALAFSGRKSYACNVRGKDNAARTQQIRFCVGKTSPRSEMAVFPCFLPRLPSRLYQRPRLSTYRDSFPAQAEKRPTGRLSAGNGDISTRLRAARFNVNASSQNTFLFVNLRLTQSFYRKGY